MSGVAAGFGASILDIRRLADAEFDPPKVWSPDDSHYRNMRPRRADAIIRLFGHDKPTRIEFERPHADRSNPPDSEDDGRWNGRCVVLFQDGEAHEIAFWGSSGD